MEWHQYTKHEEGEREQMQIQAERGKQAAAFPSVCVDVCVRMCACVEIQAERGNRGIMYVCPSERRRRGGGWVWVLWLFLFLFIMSCRGCGTYPLLLILHHHHHLSIMVWLFFLWFF